MTMPAPRGACPSLFQPMTSGDGLIVRLKPCAASLQAASVKDLVATVLRYGAGAISLTNRANLQIRGVTPKGAAAITACALNAGIAHADPAVERIRTVMASPLGADDSRAAFDSHTVARDMERRLAADSLLQALPAKFGFVVDGGGVLPLAGFAADINVRPLSGSSVSVGIAGADAAVALKVGDAAEAALRLARAFLVLTRHHPVGRMRDLVAVVGADAVFAEAGLEATASDDMPPACDVSPRVGPLALEPGFVFGCGLPFGEIGCDVLAALCDLASEYGDGTLRTTPWRTLVLVGFKGAAVARVQARAAELGLIVDPGDARLGISACPGAPACASAHVATRHDALRLVAHGGRLKGSVHVSGCAKGCAHPAPAALTLVGTGKGYDVVINGRASDLPVARNLTFNEVVGRFFQTDMEAGR